MPLPPVPVPVRGGDVNNGKSIVFICDETSLAGIPDTSALITITPTYVQENFRPLLTRKERQAAELPFYAKFQNRKRRKK
jgi:hypothetical protein